MKNIKLPLVFFMMASPVMAQERSDEVYVMDPYFYLEKGINVGRKSHVEEIADKKEGLNAYIRGENALGELCSEAHFDNEETFLDGMCEKIDTAIVENYDCLIGTDEKGLFEFEGDLSLQFKQDELERDFECAVGRASIVQSFVQQTEKIKRYQCDLISDYECAVVEYGKGESARRIGLAFSLDP